MRGPHEPRQNDPTPTGVYHARIDTTDDDVLTAFLDVIAAVENVPLTDLPPLYDSLDPAALESLLSSVGPDATVTFRYTGSRVTVSGGGTVVVEPLHP